MAKIVGKGSVLKFDIASVLTAVANVTSISHSGAEIETVETTDLGSGVGKVYQSTGYTEGGTVDYEMMFDPSLAGHQAITDDLTTPPSAGRSHSVDFSDASVWEWTAAGQGFSVNINMNDVVRSSHTNKITGLMAYDT